MFHAAMRFALRAALFLFLTLVLAVAIFVGLVLWKSQSMHGFVLAAAFGIVLTICVTIWRWFESFGSPNAVRDR